MDAWNKKLNHLLVVAISEAGPEGPLDFDMLVKSALLGEPEQNRDALAEKQVRREIGIKLRKWTFAVEQPLIPDLLDGFIQRDGDYIHTSQLSREEWDIRILKLDQTIRTLVARRTAMQEARDQAQEGEGA